MATVAAQFTCPLNGQPQRDLARTLAVAKGYVGNAPIVLTYTPEKVSFVIAGGLALNDAYATMVSAATRSTRSASRRCASVACWSRCR